MGAWHGAGHTSSPPTASCWLLHANKAVPALKPYNTRLWWVKALRNAMAVLATKCSKQPMKKTVQPYQLASSKHHCLLLAIGSNAYLVGKSLARPRCPGALSPGPLVVQRPCFHTVTVEFTRQLQ